MRNVPICQVTREERQHLGVHPAVIDPVLVPGQPAILLGFVLDAQDAGLAREIETLGLKVRVADTMMRNDDDKRRLAAQVLDFVDELAVSGQNS